MSKRYVWEKYGLQFGSATWKQATTTGIITPGGKLIGWYAVSAYDIMLGSYTGLYNQTKVAPVFIAAAGAKKGYIATNGNPVSCAEYPYVINVEKANPTTFGLTIYKAPSGAKNWYATSDGSTNYLYARDSSGNNLNNSAQFAESPGIDFGKSTTSYGKLSSSNSNAYPNGTSTTKYDYWYEYLGSDSIDPSAISIQGNPHAGQSVTISVTPGASNLYGGTISYLYQYSINGGSWTNISNTTSKSVNFTVPANAKTIQFRVRAQDDMGFVSADYVTSPSSVVERLNAWVGISDKARKGVELYVGVNGKARKVTAAYIGIDGKARRFL